MIRKIFNGTSSLSQPTQWLIDWIRGPESDSGVDVTIENALGYAPVWYAVSKISGHVGQLSLNLHKKLDRGSEHADTHPAYKLMKSRPNEFQTAISFKEQLMMHALLTGNGRAAIVRRGGVPVELIPLVPNCTHTCLVEGKKWHIVTCGDDDRCAWVEGGPGKFRDGKVYKIPDEDVLHIPGLSYDGYAGKSLLTIARNSFGLGIAARKASSRSFKNGSRPGVIIESPKGMFRDDADAKSFIDQFNDFHSGLDNAGRAALMREGMSVTTVAMSAADAQWIEQRRFERQEAALFFLLESILGDDSSVSYNSLEQKNLAYLSNCLNKWLVKWEQECDQKLISDRNQRTHFFKFDVDELLRSDARTKMETLSSGIAARIYSPNEARLKLNMNPYEGGDEYANPAISPGAAGAVEDVAEEAEEPVGIEDANRLAIVARMKHLIGVESHRAKDSAKRHPDFNTWVNAWYPKWQKTLSKAVAEFGGHQQVAADYCSKNKSQLLDVAGTVNKEGLPEAIEELVSSWSGKAEALADTIINEGNDNV